MRNMEVQQEITFGESICIKLHKIYYPEEVYDSKLVDKIAKLFTYLKKDSKKLFVDDSHLEMLQKISHYNMEDFKELCEVINLTIRN